jgi:cytoskeletal protein CcmA (bactofilin family)
MKIENFGDVTIYSQPNSGAHLNMIHRTDLVGEYILIEREGVTGRRAVMGSPDGNPNGMEFGLVDNGTQRFLAKTDGTIFASSSISGASLAVTGAISGGAISGASLAATGAVTGASLAATGAVTGASLAATGAITGASLTTTGNIKANGGQLEVDNGGFIDGGITPGEQTTMNISGADLVILGQDHNLNDFLIIGNPVDDASTDGYQFLMWRTATGVVESIGLRVTQIRDSEGTVWYVRNGEILRVGNHSQGWSRIILDLPLAYNSDLEKAKKALEAAAAKVSETPGMKTGMIGKAEVWGVQALAGEGIIFRMVQQVRPSKKDAIARALRLEVKKSLDKAGVLLSSPEQRTRAAKK